MERYRPRRSARHSGAVTSGLSGRRPISPGDIEPAETAEGRTSKRSNEVSDGRHYHGRPAPTAKTSPNRTFFQTMILPRPWPKAAAELALRGVMLRPFSGKGTAPLAAKDVITDASTG
jgi:hypothetical protein